MSQKVSQELAELRRAFNDLRKQYEPGGFTKEEQDDLDAFSKRIADFQVVVGVGLAGGNDDGATKGSAITPSAPTAIPQAQGGTATAPTLANRAGGGGNGSGAPGGRSGGGGGGGNDKTPYPGHDPTPDGSYPKVKRPPTEAEKKGRIQAERDLKRDPSNPKSTYDPSALKKKNYKKIAVGDDGSPGLPVDEHGNPVDPKNLHSDTDLKKAQGEYLDPTNKKGKSVKDLKVSGKTFETLHQELEAKGFKLQDREGRLKDFNRDSALKDKMEYRLRDGSFTPDLEIAKKNGVPQYIYVHPDGGMVRLKPEGTPGNAQRNEVNISKGVLYKVDFDPHGKVKDTSFDNEAFKVGDDGKITARQPTMGQKTPSQAGGLRKEPRGMEPKIDNPHNDPKIEQRNKEIEKRNADRKKGYDDVAMEKGHVLGPTTPKPGTTSGGASSGDTGGAKPGTGSTAAKVVIPGADDARSTASKFRGQVEAQRKESAERLLRMQKLEPVLKAKVDAATGNEKKALAEKQALLAKEIGAAERAVARSKADLEAIDNPGSKREELLAILARQKAGGAVTEFTEITAAGLDPYKKGKVNRDVTTTTTSYADGKATTESVRSQQKVGLDGYTKSESHDKTVTDGHTTARSSHEKKVNVSLGGKLSKDEKQVIEVQKADGSKAALEVSKNKEISTKGASQTRTATVTKVDGSSVSTTTKQGVERGEGKVIGTTSSSVTKTTASGTASTTDKSASGGMIAGKDGIGFKGGVTGGKSMTSKKGRQAGASLSLHANVTCKIGDPKGEPKLYPVTVTVSFVASGSLSAGAGKKGDSKFSGSFEAKKSLEGSMVVTHDLGEAELADYVKTLEAASQKGSKVAATKQEFAIISAGVNQSWDVARQMWEAGGGKLNKQAVYGQKQTGDSVQVSETQTDGFAVKGKVYGAGVGYGKTHTDATSRKATRNETGGVDLDSKHEKGSQTDLSASLDVGVAGAEAGTTEIHKTRFGYSFAIDPKNDPDGKILEHFNLCKSEQDYHIFRATHYGKVTLIGKMEGQTDADGTNVGVSIAGKSLKLGTDQIVDKEERTDSKGNVVSKTTTGEAGAGGELGSLSDSKRDQATAESDAKGNASLTLTSTTKQNYGSRVQEKKDKKALEKLTSTGKASGVLTDAAGGEEDDTAVQDVSVLKLANKDLRRIGKVAVNSMPALARGWENAWMGVIRRWQEKEDWKKAGFAIAKAKGSPSAVAHALAEFIGGDRVERLETVQLMVRGGYKQTGGKASEFPDSLRDIRADYDLVTDDGLPDKMNTLANKQGNPAAAKECVRLLAIVDRIQPRVQACKDFDNSATKTEMLSELNECRRMLNEAVHGFGGNLKPQDDPKVLAEEGSRLMKLCYAYGVEQESLVAKLEDQPAHRVEQRADGKKLIKQLEALQDRWKNEYDRLQANYAKRKLVLPEFPYAQGVPQLRPTETLVAKYEKIFVR